MLIPVQRIIMQTHSHKTVNYVIQVAKFVRIFHHVLLVLLITILTKIINVSRNVKKEHTLIRYLKNVYLAINHAQPALKLKIVNVILAKMAMNLQKLILVNQFALYYNNVI